MIASLRGRLAALLRDAAVIEVGGVGYRVVLTPRALAALPPRGSEVTVHTSTYVREDVLALYGFLSPVERDAFELLLGASGVGPRLALAVLSVHAPDVLWRAVRADDTDALILVPGIGRKGAAKLLLELKGRIGDEHVTLPGTAGAVPVYAEVREALTALGYGTDEIRTALAALPDDAATHAPQQLVRLALKALTTTQRART